MYRTLVLVALIGLVACKKAPTATTPSNKADAPLDAAVMNDPLAFLPLDSELVMGIEGDALRASALWHKFEPQIVSAIGPKLEQIRTECGFDPMKEIQSVAAGGSVKGGEKFEGVMVVRGVTGARALDCFAKAFVADGQTASVKDGVITVVDDESTMLGKIVGGTTYVGRVGKTVTLEMLEHTIRAGAPLRGSPSFVKLFDKREPNATVWGMANGNAEFMASMAQAGARPKSVDGTVVLTDKVVGALRMTFSSQAEADKIAGELRPMLGQFGSMFDKVDLKSGNSVVQLDVIATEEQIRSMIGMMAAFM